MRLALVLALAVLLVPAQAHAAPANDNFADARDLNVVGDSTGSVDLSNFGATKEAGEPAHAGNPGGRSVWFAWSAPVDGSVPNIAFTVSDTSFDTLLGVYTGASVSALSEVASNDDLPAFGGGSVVSFGTAPGTQYFIAVDGFAGKAGTASLFWEPAPPNDNFADAIALTGESGSRVDDQMSGATVEVEERQIFGGSIWYSWSPPADGTYSFSTVGTRFDSVLTVYEGTSLDSLELIALNDDDPDRGCCTSWIPLVDAEGAKTYMIRISPLGGSTTRPATLVWRPLILGTAGADTLVGTPNADEIRGRGGDDMIQGADGNDLIFGGRGDDTVSGLAGDDRVFGGDHDDLLLGGLGMDVLVDRTGRDVLRGGADADRLVARDFRADDLLVGGPGADECVFDPGDRRETCS